MWLMRQQSMKETPFGGGGLKGRGKEQDDKC